MTLITWTQEYLVGIETMDAEHGRLVMLINKLDDATNQKFNEQIVGSALVEMVDYAKTHFATEEKFMAQHGYPEIEKHKLLHEYFVGRVKVFAKSFLGGNHEVLEEMRAFLKIWLVDHICSADKTLAAFLSAKGVH